MTHGAENKILERLIVLEQRSVDRDENVKTLNSEVRELSSKTTELEYAVKSQNDKLDSLTDIIKNHAESFKAHDQFEHEMVSEVKAEVAKLKDKIDENRSQHLINETQKKVTLKAFGIVFAALGFLGGTIVGFVKVILPLLKG